MRRELAGLACAALAAACSGERIAECDALLATAEQVRACDRLEQGPRAQLEQSVRSIKEALDRLEDVGPGRAPAELLNETRRTCARQDAEIQKLYQKVAPGCLR
jgi:hypothetical protein